MIQWEFVSSASSIDNQEKNYVGWNWIQFSSKLHTVNISISSDKCLMETWKFWADTDKTKNTAVTTRNPTHID